MKGAITCSKLNWQLVTSGVPQYCVCLGPIGCITLTTNLDDEIECTITESVYNSKLGGRVDTLERIVTVQNTKLTAIIWGLTKIKSCTWNRIIPSSWTGRSLSGLGAALLERCWRSWEAASWPEDSSVSSQPWRQTMSWAASPKQPAGQGICLFQLPWHSWGHTKNIMSSFAPLSSGEMLKKWNAAKVMRYLAYEEMLKELSLFTLEKRKLVGYNHSLPVPAR